MIKTRTRFLQSLFKPTSNFDAVASPGTNSPSPIRTLYKRLTGKKHPPVYYECTYCNETKRQGAFVPRAALPYTCQYHLVNATTHVCKKCLEASLSAQLDCKALLDVGCPQCNHHWDPQEVRFLISWRDEKKFRMLEEMARERVVVPEVEDLPDGLTMEVLLEKGARFCPWCRWPFIKDGGCDAMQCIKCHKCFNIDYAMILEDKDGNRAAPVMDDLELVV